MLDGLLIARWSYYLCLLLLFSDIVYFNLHVLCIILFPLLLGFYPPPFLILTLLRCKLPPRV